MQRIHLLIFIKQFSPEMTSYLVYSLESYMKAGKLLEIYFFPQRYWNQTYNRFYQVCWEGAHMVKSYSIFFDICGKYSFWFHLMSWTSYARNSVHDIICLRSFVLFHVTGIHVFCLVRISSFFNPFHHDLEAIYELSPCQVSFTYKVHFLYQYLLCT